MVKYQAHRGVSSENPENTMPAFVAAVEQGYNIIEADIAVTADMQFVLLHDNTINRTARNLDGSELESVVNIKDITYEQACEYDFGSYFAMKFEGTKIPLLKDLLRFLSDTNTKIKIDNKYSCFSTEEKKLFFDLIRPFVDIVQLTCNCIEEIEFAQNYLPEMHFHYDGDISKDVLETLWKTVSKDRLTIWIDYKNLSAISIAKRYAEVGVWNISNYEQFDEAIRFGADITETDGMLKPQRNEGVIVDMHTHSQYSHDSTELIRNTYETQKSKGIAMFAVTDHCDVFEYANGDTFDYIAESFDDVVSVNKDSDGSVTVLSGVEIGEGFWYPDAARGVEKMKPYDVILGSVHVIKIPNEVKAYSCTDFTHFTDEDVFDYLTMYFRDMLQMLETREFDVLTHLTCPIRYLCGKYGLEVDITSHLETIKKILQIIIDKGIALEVNTSSYGMINNFMPDESILKMYYDMGGYLITLGSDAHIASNAAMYFDEAIKCLKNIGFRNIFYYKNRQCYQCSL